MLAAISETLSTVAVTSRAGGDQRDVVDRRGDVAEPVEQLVGRNEVRPLTDDREPDLADLVQELVHRQLDTKSGYRLELVQRPAGVPQAASAHLAERNSAGGHDGTDREGCLVPNAAGRMLVDDFASDRLPELDRFAAADHRVGERERLGSVQPAEVDGHTERGHLVVGNLAARVREHELGDLVRSKLLAVALATNQLCCVDHARELSAR